WSWSTYLYMEGCTVDSTIYGVMSFADAHIGNTTIDVLWDDWYWGVGSFDTYGLYAGYGDYSLHNLDINIDADMNGTRNSTYISNYYYIYGIYIYSANVGRLEPDRNKEFSIDIDIDLEIWSYYETSSYVRFYNRFYTRAIYMSGDTICRAIKDIDIDVSEDVKCVANNASRGAYFRVYNYQEYIYSSISSSGEAPSEISGITMSGFGAVPHTQGEVYMLMESWSNTAIEIRDADGAQPGDVVTSYNNIMIEGGKYDIVFYLPRYGEWILTDSTFDGIEARRILEFYYTDMDFIVAQNKFVNITAMNDYTVLFRLYRPQAEGLLNNNTFSNIEGWRFMEIYYADDRVYFQNNLVTDQLPWEHSYDSWFWIYENQDRVVFRWNTFSDSMYYNGMILTEWTRDKFVLEANTIENNEFMEYMFRSYRNYNDIDIVSNVIQWNTGPLLENDYVYGRWTVSDNEFMNNDVGADYLIYTYRAYNEMKITDNKF
ncbi:MAG: hypothetical protein GWN18_14750, partial [Thermoplasmata archaeon]|nr:hypothetical protein [Thermoplasmata archaeon]NIS21203.1 hypothetical protein [Thermoplasmata archaeon]NIT78697.1 hypothetical protein [Thermoplasmata archaeon]NIU50257.1 hypothetical protein [Thermoplasmata archaeon]NIV79955.1 hypothetical protein [Thermoplasmata archaeon]